MSGCVHRAIGKVLQEVLLKITQVFFVKPCILQEHRAWWVSILSIQKEKNNLFAPHLTSESRWPCWGASFLRSCRMVNTWNMTDLVSGESRWEPSLLFQGLSLALASTQTSSSSGTRVAAKFWTASAESRPSPTAGPGSISGLKCSKMYINSYTHTVILKKKNRQTFNSNTFYTSWLHTWVWRWTVELVWPLNARKPLHGFCYKSALPS